MEYQVVYSFKRSEFEEIRISIRAFKGERYLDLRLFFRSESSPEWLPTKKAITVSSEFAGSLAKGIRLAERRLAKRT